jgi:hypothetical protein
MAGLFLLCLILKFVSYPLFLSTATLYSFALLLVVIHGFPFSRPLDGTFRRALILWGIVAAATLLPVSVSLQHTPGPPRFVEYVKGKPTRSAWDASKRGECVLGGCVVWPLEPRWVWVW